MDQLMAYKILKLEPGCSLEEIKAAYAALSKQYHPEEEPEKFQEIHEAYVTLTRKGRRRDGQSRDVEMSLQHVVEIPEPEPVETSVSEDMECTGPLDFNKIERNLRVEETEEEEKEIEYAFEEAMQNAKQKEQEQLHELVLEATAELKVLVSPKYRNNRKAFKKFFKEKRYEPIIRKAEFLEKLCEVLDETKLRKNVYSYIIDFYRLGGKQPSELSPIGRRLYQILDEKAGIRQKVNPGVGAGVVAGLVAGIQALKPLFRMNDTLAVIALCIFAVILLAWVGKKLFENHSIILTQAVIAFVLMLSQFVVIMFDLYGTVFGSVEDGNSVAAIIFLLAGAWLAVVIVVGIGKVILNLIRWRK